MGKTVEYYMGLSYRVSIQSIPKELGGGWWTFIPEFGLSMIGDGETIQEAVDDLNSLKRIAIQRFLDEGRIIPLPFNNRIKYDKLYW